MVEWGSDFGRRERSDKTEEAIAESVCDGYGHSAQLFECASGVETDATLVFCANARCQTTSLSRHSRVVLILRLPNHPAMSRDIDAILERLDRYEARLDLTREQLVQFVDQRIDLLKLDVKQIRERILGGRARTIRDRKRAKNPLPTGLSVSDQDHHVSVPPLDDSRPNVSKTNNKRSRAPSRGKSASSVATKRQRDNRVSDANQENVDESNEKGPYKINTLSLNCTEEDCKITASTKNDLRKHLKLVHKLDPFRCLAAGCGERFKDQYICIGLYNSACY